MEKHTHPNIWTRQLIVILIVALLIALFIWQYFSYKIIEIKFQTNLINPASIELSKTTI